MTLKRAVRFSLKLGVAAFALLVLAVVVFNAIGSRKQRGFHPVNEPVSPEHRALTAGIKNYLRPEESTYLTFPEWHLVFIPQEYARHLADRAPSGFPYFRSIAQLWEGYAEVYGITKRHYPFNAGDHLMEVVIVSSSSIEFAIKGAYENTVGRLSEWIGGTRTEEDVYAAKVAKAYGDFIPDQPWYDFAFGHALHGLWSDTPLFGKHFLRKWERKIFLTGEYGVKALYAAAIRAGSHSVYGLADTEIYATIAHPPDAIFANPKVRRVQDLNDGSCVITLPHYQGFTDTLPSIAGQDVQILDLAGNDEILLTVLAPIGWKYDLKEGAALFEMETLDEPRLQRVAVQAPVKSLCSMLRAFDAEGVKLEHLFDY